MGSGLGGGEEPRPLPGLTPASHRHCWHQPASLISVLLDKAQVLVCSNLGLHFICSFKAASDSWSQTNAWHLAVPVFSCGQADLYEH